MTRVLLRQVFRYLSLRIYEGEEKTRRTRKKKRRSIYKKKYRFWSIYLGLSPFFSSISSRSISFCNIPVSYFSTDIFVSFFLKTKDIYLFIFIFIYIFLFQKKKKKENSLHLFKQSRTFNNVTTQKSLLSLPSRNFSIYIYSIYIYIIYNSYNIKSLRVPNFSVSLHTQSSHYSVKSDQSLM